MWWSFIKSLYIDHVKTNNWKINVGKINPLAYKLMHNHKFILIDVIQMSITWFYIYLCIIWGIYFGKKLYMQWKNRNRFFENRRKMSKQRARTFRNTCVSTSFVPNTKVGHHLLVLENLAICVEGSCSNLGRTFLFFSLKYNNRLGLTNL